MTCIWLKCLVRTMQAALHPLLPQFERSRKRRSWRLLHRLGRKGQKFFLHSQLRCHERKRALVASLLQESCNSYQRLNAGSNNANPWTLHPWVFEDEVVEPVKRALGFGFELCDIALQRRDFQVLAFERCAVPVPVAALFTLQDHAQLVEEADRDWLQEVQAVQISHPHPRETGSLFTNWQFGLKFIVRNFLYSRR